MDDLASMFSPVTAEEIDDAQTSGLVAAASPAEKGPRRPGDFQKGRWRRPLDVAGTC